MERYERMTKAQLIDAMLDARMDAEGWEREARRYLDALNALAALMLTFDDASDKTPCVSRSAIHQWRSVILAACDRRERAA